MKNVRIATAIAAAAALSAAFTAVAQNQVELAAAAIVPAEVIYVLPAIAPFGPYHGGYVTNSDAQLMGNAVAALASDPRMNGSVVTMVANHGELIVNGTTTDVAQAARIETKLRRLPGATRVSAWFDSSGG